MNERYLKIWIFALSRAFEATQKNDILTVNKWQLIADHCFDMASN